MSDIIHLLPDSVANQIAAGEVIQRPASVIKELVENAVDAGATDIKVIIRDGGRTLIQVIDNGKGMSETDARMAFERHATSKISQASDLFSLQTMGFRGEALPSICAIAQVELRTNDGRADTGTRIIINGSRLETQEPCVCDKGSNFMVKNLFFNAPARRKFMKSDSVELKHIMAEFERLALVNNDKRMSIDTGTRQIDLRAGNFRQRIADLWRNGIGNQLLPVEVDTSLVKISGYVSRPEFARRRNQLQYLIVNGRNMRHPYFSKAILNCYENLIAAGTQPAWFLKFEVDPASIDVNVHPTKNEIKFENESEIWSILSACVKNALGKFSAVPSIDFTSDTIEVCPPRQGEYVEQPKVKVTPGYNPFRETGSGSASPAKQDVRNWESLYDDFIRESSRKETPKPESQPTLLDKSEITSEPAMICMQLDRRYIATTSERGLTLIDQHRAHLRILYDRIIEAAKKEKPVMQRLMFPESIHLSGAQIEAWERIAEDVAKMGFLIEYVADDEWQVCGAPSILDGRNPAHVVLQIIDSVCDDDENPDAVNGCGMLEHVALLTARSTAIERGKKLSQTEMEQLLSDLFRLPEPTYTPNGNRIILEIPYGKISSMFT